MQGRGVCRSHHGLQAEPFCPLPVIHPSIRFLVLSSLVPLSFPLFLPSIADLLTLLSLTNPPHSTMDTYSKTDFKSASYGFKYLHINRRIFNKLMPRVHTASSALDRRSTARVLIPAHPPASTLSEDQWDNSKAPFMF